MSWKFDRGLMREVWRDVPEGLTVAKLQQAKLMLEKNDCFDCTHPTYAMRPGAAEHRRIPCPKHEYVTASYLQLDQKWFKTLTTIPFIEFTTKEETPVSDAVKRADQVKSDVARLEGNVEARDKQLAQKDIEMARLRQELSDARRQPITAQRALLVYRDGRTKNIELKVENDPAQYRGFRPVRWFYEMEAPMHPVGVGVWDQPMPSPTYKRTFVCVSEQSMDAKTIVYVER